MFNEVVSDIGDSEGVSLYPKSVTIATLSSKRSRHTTPTAAHHMMDTVSKHLPKSGDSAVVVVCHKTLISCCGMFFSALDAIVALTAQTNFRKISEMIYFFSRLCVCASTCSRVEVQLRVHFRPTH